MNPLWKCSCGNSGNYVDKSKVIGINEFGAWVNCSCRSTFLIKPHVLETMEIFKASECPLVKKIRE